MRERDRETQREITSGALATVEWPQERELIERERDGVDEALSSFRMKIIRYFRSIKKLFSFLLHS